MEAHEASELIEEAGEAHHQKNRSALTISIFAMVLAITSLGGSNAGKEITQENILAANSYAFYQAKSIRQTSLKIAATDMELQMLREPGMNAPAKEAMLKKIDDYKKTVERYESEPEKGEGKKELLERAKEHELVRDHAIRQDPWFDYAEGALQIAIVLLSVSIIGSLPALYFGGLGLGLVGALCSFNGFFLFYG
ncbi:MAG: DUF4337 domain-containing protein [Betaproteobacteria bacterium]|jgi:hypothetical protein